MIRAKVTTRGAYGPNREYYCDDIPAGARFVADCKSGWYCDDFQNETMKGFVIRWPSKNGAAVYVPGIRSSDSCGVTLYPRDMTDDESEAMHSADDRARIAAENEQEYREAWQAGSRAAEMSQEAADIRADLLTTLAAHRVIRAKLRREVESMLESITEKRDARDKLRSDFSRSPGFADGFAL